MSEPKRWIVRDAVLNARNGNGIWARSHTLLGALLLREKIYAGRYRGSQVHSWRRVIHYAVPDRGALIIIRGGESGV